MKARAKARIEALDQAHARLVGDPGMQDLVRTLAAGEEVQPGAEAGRALEDWSAAIQGARPVIEIAQETDRGKGGPRTTGNGR